MAMLVSILTEFYKFVDEISLCEHNYVSKQSLSGIFSFTEKNNGIIEERKIGFCLRWRVGQESQMTS